jgi:hypothetical protein
MSPVVLVALVALWLWGQFGFPSPTTLAQWSSAEQECVRFAKKHNLGSDKIVKAMSSWIKKGKVVVELGVFEEPACKLYTPSALGVREEVPCRTCVVEGDDPPNATSMSTCTRKPLDTSYTPRICTVGGGSIWLVPVLEANAWR